MSFDCRRGGRLAGTFWVQVVGSEEEPVLRSGNISISGVYFDTDESYGSPGTIRRFRLALDLTTFESGQVLDLLGRVVREVGYEDLTRGRVVSGVAFEYLVEQRRQRVAIESLLRELASRQLEKAQRLRLACHLSAEVSQDDQTSGSATVKTLSVEGMVLRSGWPMSLGQPLRVEVRAPNSSRIYQFEGVATSCVADAQAEESTEYTIEVRFSTQTQGQRPFTSVQHEVAFEVESSIPVSSSIRGAVEALLEETVVPSSAFEPRPMAHLTGTLEQISLWSMLGFLETERRTGVLRLRWGANRGEVFLDDGRVIDVSSSYRDASPRQQLAHLLDWLAGEFELEFTDVDRPDTIGATTTALLMDLAKEKDEDPIVGELELGRGLLPDEDP